jgi:hypothetical protein
MATLKFSEWYVDWNGILEWYVDAKAKRGSIGRGKPEPHAIRQGYASQNTHHAQVISVLKRAEQTDDMLAIVRVIISKLAEDV